MWQIGGPGQAQHRCIVTPERALQGATMIVQRPLVHRATVTMIGEQPEGDFELSGGKSGDLDVDRVVTDHFVPRLDLHQNLAGSIFCLPGFVYLNSGRGRHPISAGLIADHATADQAAANQPSISRTTRTGLRAGNSRNLCLYGHWGEDRQYQ